MALSEFFDRFAQLLDRFMRFGLSRAYGFQPAATAPTVAPFTPEIDNGTRLI